MSTVQDLQAALPQLTTKDQEFALSLMTTANRKGGVTSRMQLWVDKLVQRAQGAGDQRQTASVGDADDLPYGEAKWYGRIRTDGTFEGSHKFDPPAGLVEALVKFAADPAGEASRHGRLKGRCCFCDLPLKDERSTAVGFGPTCAKSWGLVWGRARAEFSCEGQATPQVEAMPGMTPLGIK